MPALKVNPLIEGEVVVSVAGRPMRKDVVRNRALLLAAANELFAERGADVTLDDIAKHAGVGVATAYRHFENKQALVEAMFDARIVTVLEHVRVAAKLSDPRESFVTLFAGFAELQSRDRGVQDVLTAQGGFEHIAKLRTELQPIIEDIVDRAKRAGVLRTEFEASDLPLLLTMLGSVAWASSSVEPELWRRYLGMLLDGTLAESQPRNPIEISALTETQLENVLRDMHDRR